MKQSKKLSFLETLTNILIGLLFSYFIQIILYPILNISVSTKQNIIITLVFFIASLIRGYFIRRFFNSIK
ncbi:DUF7220 family protein [Flavobacterium facile]|uniref:DUF7220 family protein n=1 Tax=Flavobacterium facile TaxID=2893174 RepID=UPI002E79A35A|nr:hypothetical protein [Flavobacterium sp. T-12]